MDDTPSVEDLRKLQNERLNDLWRTAYGLLLLSRLRDDGKEEVSALKLCLDVNDAICRLNGLYAPPQPVSDTKTETPEQIRERLFDKISRMEERLATEDLVYPEPSQARPARAA